MPDLAGTGLIAGRQRAVFFPFTPSKSILALKEGLCLLLPLEETLSS